MQEAEPEIPSSLNRVSSDCGVAQIQPVVQSQVSEDALMSPQVEMGTHGAPSSRTAATQTSLQPMERGTAHSLGTGDAHIGSSPLPSIIPPQPLVLGAVERTSPDPLDNELEKLKRVEELNDQTYADLNLRLNYERDREIQDVVAQIHAKYDLKKKEGDAVYKLKNNDLRSYMDRVYLHKKLVEVYRIVASGSHLRQGVGVAANAPQQSFDMLSSAGGSQSPYLGASSTSLPSNTSPAREVTLIRPRSSHPLVINSQNPASPLLHATSTSSHYSSVTSRSLLNSTTPARNMMAPISTAPPMANHTITMEGFCSPASHLQHFRPQAGNLTNQHGNFSSYPTSHISNQVRPPAEALRPPWGMDSIPGSSGGTDFVSLSDDD